MASACFAVHRGPPRRLAKGAFRRHIGILVNGLLGAGKQVLAASLRALAQDPEVPSMTDTDSIILGVAAFLFALALIALIAWPFKTFVLTGRSGTSLLRGRDLRLGVVATASVDGHRKLILIRRDTVEHLFRGSGRRADRDRNRGTTAARAAARGRDHRQGRDASCA